MEDANNDAASRRLLLAATVRGRVQNVGFRVFVLEAARKLSLGGFVRNRGDGSVEVVASGERERLELLLSHLRRGPVGARVDSVETDWREGAQGWPSEVFEVRS